MDPESVELQDIADQTYQCFPHPFYSYAMPDLYAKALSLSYHPQKYLNVTDKIEEYLCVSPKDAIDSISCKHSTVRPI